MEQITLQPQELRIGNWVMAVYMPYGHEQGSNYEKINAHTIYSIADDLYTSFKHYGIPLTPDILEKLSTRSITDCIGNKVYVFEVEVPNIGRGNFILTLIGGAYYTNDALTPYLYLHQLQNLYFALCGKELEITL